MRKKVYVSVILMALVLASASLLYFPNAKDYLTSVISADTDSVFSDLSSGSPFFDAVNYVQSQGIVNGYEDGTYKPNNKINRAEFVKVIISAIFTKDQISSCIPVKIFSDVSASDWFYPYICTASTNGIVNGYADGTFKPGNYINFTEASKVIVNAFGYETSGKEIWYQQFVEKLEEFKAIPSTICYVSKSISRGEMAEMIYRLKEKITDKNSANFFTGNPEKVEATTFVKSYRVKNNADSYGIVQASDGGYAITGYTWTPSELCGRSMFFIKADSNGNKQWSKVFHNCSSEGRAITQLTDGSYVAAGQVVDFRTDEEQAELEGQGDNIVWKLDGNGNRIWARTVSQQSIDESWKVLPNQDGGFTMFGLTGVLVGQPDVADVMHTLFLGNFNTNGETNWFKKIEGDEIMAKSVTQTSDGGYIMIGNIKLVEENNQKVPALVKLDQNGEFEWATGLENVPMEIPNLIMNPDGKGFTVGTPNKLHVAFGQFTEAEQTDDGGYIALGTYFSVLSDAAIAKGLKEALGQSNFIGVKVDKEGKLEWARSIKLKKYLEESVIERTSDDGYIIMGNSAAIAFENQEILERQKSYEEMMNAYNKKYPTGTPETPASKRDMEAIADTIEATSSPFNARHVILVKLDKNFNYQWGKDIGGTRDLDGYDVTQTSDSGYAIAGTWHTGIKWKELGSWLEYTEAMIMKLDVNGNLGNDNGLIADYSDIESSDVSSYIIVNKLSSPELIVEYSMDNVSRSLQLSDRGSVNTTVSETTTYNVQSCNAEVTDGFAGSTGGAGGTSPVAKTRAQMKYDDTKEIEATSTKGVIIDDEIRPILKGIFNNEVKLWDDFAGGWVAYRFSRLVTKDDISKIEIALEGLGYKLDRNDNGDFTAVKIGLTLNFHFYLGNTNTGHLDINY